MKRSCFSFVPLAVLLAAPVVAAPPTPAPKPPVSETQKQYDAALSAARAGKMNRAIALCRAALKQTPTAAPIWATLAHLLSGQGNNTDALAASRKAVALQPKNAAFVADLGNFLLRSGDVPNAEKVAIRALAIDPKNDLALSVATTCRLSARRDVEAIPLLVRLQAVRGGKDVAVAENLFAAKLRVGDAAGALSAAQTVAELKPSNAEATLGVIDLALQNGNVALAEKYLLRLAKVAPKSPLPAYYRGKIALADAGKPLPTRLANAESLYQKASNLAPKEALLRTELGIAQVSQVGLLKGAAQKAKLSAARTNLTAALLFDNHSVQARRGLAVVAEGEKYWEDAAAQYEALLQIAPGDTAARRRYAGVLLVAGRKGEGYAQFYELATLLPQDTHFLKELASFLLEDKNYTKARAVYGQVIERAPGDVEAFLGMGQAYGEEGKFPQARDAYQSAILSDPKREAAYLLLSQLYINDGETDAEAIATLEALLVARPDSQTGRAVLIERYLKAKRADDAKREIEKLVTDSRNRYRLALGNLLMEQGKDADTIAQLEQVAVEEPENVAVLITLAGAYRKTKRDAEATATYQKAAQMAQSVLQKNRADADARAALVQARTALGDPGAAALFLERLDAAR